MFRGFKGQSLLGGYNDISSVGFPFGNESLGHYSEVGCLSEGLIEVLLYTQDGINACNQGVWLYQHIHKYQEHNIM